jgi:hypothetical protein
MCGDIPPCLRHVDIIMMKHMDNFKPTLTCFFFTLCLHICVGPLSNQASTSIYLSPSFPKAPLVPHFTLIFFILSVYIMSFLSCYSSFEFHIPFGRLPFSFMFQSFFGSLSSFILKTLPRHLILLFMNLSVSSKFCFFLHLVGFPSVLHTNVISASLTHYLPSPMSVFLFHTHICLYR